VRQIKLLFLILALFLISCYRGHGLSPLVEETNVSGISGRVTFIGTWPDSTKEVRVAVLKNYPEGITDPDSLIAFVIGNLVAFSDTIPRFVDHYDYQLSLNPDIYAWVMVVWLPDIPFYLLGAKELGAYYGLSYGQSKIPTQVTVIPGATTGNINIIANFANLNRKTPFFKIRGNNEKPEDKKTGK